MQDEYRGAVIAVEHPAGPLDDLAIAGAFELRNSCAAFGVNFKLPDVLEDARYELGSRRRIL